MLLRAVPQFSPGEAENQRIRVLLDDIRAGTLPRDGASVFWEQSTIAVAWPVASEDCSRTTVIRL